VAFGDADLPAFFGDMGVPVAIGGARTTGLLDENQVQMVSASGTVVNVTQTTVLIPTGTLAGLAQDAAITVAGVGYKVRNFSPVDDGRLTEITLAK
jgi:hypothetical protein